MANTDFNHYNSGGYLIAETRLAGTTMTVVKATTNSTTVTSSPANILGIYVNVTTSAHTVLVVDGTRTKLTLPASTSAGTKIDFHSAIFTTNIIIDPDDAATAGEVVVFWRAV